MILSTHYCCAIEEKESSKNRIYENLTRNIKMKGKCHVEQ